MSTWSAAPTCMWGAIAGDTTGSPYEWHNIKYKLPPEDMVTGHARFTDDSVMTCAVAEGLMRGLEQLPRDWLTGDRQQAETVIKGELIRAMKQYGRRFPRAGYGGSFRLWLTSEQSAPYNSWGNGSAMRVSFAGWAAHSLEEAETLAAWSAEVTHNHPEGVKGAQAVAGSLFLLRSGGSKADVRVYASRYYDLDFTLDDIRAAYEFDVSCQGSVPQAIVAFLTGQDFADVLAEAISIGGDSDTIAAIAGSLAEVIYPIPAPLLIRVKERCDPFLWQTVERADAFLKAGGLR